MLLKKILHLKKKIKKNYCDIQKIDSLIENNKSLNIKLASLNIQIDTLKDQLEEKNKELNLVYESLDNINILKEKILDLQKYKEICASDIPVMASAITELYNILNVIVTGRPIINKKFDEEDLSFEEEISYNDCFENEESFFNEKKKKKVYH